MLPRELLVVWKRKGNIKPRYLREMVLAEKIIQIFQEHQGKKYKELLGKLEKLENNDFKVVRGLSTLLVRRCVFTPSSELPVKKIRAFLFKHGFVKTPREREDVLKQAAQHFQTSKKQIEEAMFSDLEEEQIVSGFKPLTPQELVGWYNLSLTQTLMFDALELTFKTWENLQRIFRQIKYLGLMYEINEKVHVTGPASLFKKNRKYGTSLAKLLPLIMKTEKWEINAKIETTVDKEPRILNFNLRSSSGIPLPISTESTLHFDSEIEQQFYKDFRSLNLGWEIKREPDIVKTGTSVIIPDFGFYKNNMTYYLEIVGFWTPEYLKKKILKLRKAEAPITVAVNKNLNCKKEDFVDEVLFYNNKIPVMPIVKILKEMEEKQIKKERQKLGEIKIKEDIVSLQKLADDLNVNPEILTTMNIPGYVTLGDQIVSKSFLKQIEKKIKPSQGYEKTVEILKKHNLTVSALEHMNYKIIWQGLKPVKVVKKNKRGGGVKLF